MQEQQLVQVIAWCCVTALLSVSVFLVTSALLLGRFVKERPRKSYGIMPAPKDVAPEDRALPPCVLDNHPCQPCPLAILDEERHSCGHLGLPLQRVCSASRRACHAAVLKDLPTDEVP